MDKDNVMKAMFVVDVILEAVCSVAESAVDAWEDAIEKVSEVMDDGQPQAAEAQPRYEDFADGVLKDLMDFYKATQRGR